MLPEWWPSSPSSIFLRQLICHGTICLLTSSGMALTTGCCSWLGKLETAKRVLVDDAPKTLPSEDALANAFIYLQVKSKAFCRSHHEPPSGRSKFAPPSEQFPLFWAHANHVNCLSVGPWLLTPS